MDCASSLCIEDGLVGRTYCTAMCLVDQAAACPGGYVCEQTQEGAFCVAPAVVEDLCDFCNTGSQCASGLCVSVPFVNGNMSFCSRACDPTPGQPQQCPSGFSCMQSQQATTVALRPRPALQ